MVFTKMMAKSLLVLYFVIASAVSATRCLSRRCLANNLIDKQLYSAPQPPDCFINVNLTAIQYETLSFNLQTLQFSSHIKVFMEWTDPDLAWTDSKYNFTNVLLPFTYIWLPNLTVNNAIYTAVHPLSKDILVTRDGTVTYAIQMYITVVCDMNLFTYPFVEDTCIVAINGWNRSYNYLISQTCGSSAYGNIQCVAVLWEETNRGFFFSNQTTAQFRMLCLKMPGDFLKYSKQHVSSKNHATAKGTEITEIRMFDVNTCGVTLQYGKITTVGGKRGEWQTLDVNFCGGAHNYLQVTLYLNPFNALVSLVLPTALIMVVDLVSFALPLNGERNAFKIKLVFSFTMFLLILSKQVPQGGPCSPLIYYHFCFCLIVLVVSLLVSMMLSQLARTGSLWPGRPRKQSGSGSSMAQQDNAFHQNDTEINCSKVNSVNLMTEVTSIEKISSFVNNMDKEIMEKKRKQDYAKSWDNFCFITYLFLDIIYMLCAFAIFKTQQCSSNKLSF